MKERDGLNDVFGCRYFPTDCDSTRSHPVLDYIYPGHPDMALAVIDARIGANMTFDAFVFAERNHSLAGEPYAIHHGWDDSVRHRRHEEPSTDEVIRQPR